MKQFVREWTSATIALAVVLPRTSRSEESAAWEATVASASRGEIDSTEAHRRMVERAISQFEECESHTGTAFLVEDEHETYLVSAAHVFCPREPDEFGQMLRVADPDDPDVRVATLRGFTAGAPSTWPLAIDYDQDVAVLRLTGVFEKRFLEHARHLGHEPMSVARLARDAPSVCDEVFTVGFPASSSLGQLALDKYEMYWRSALLRRPVTTFGRISMLYEPQILADITIAPGNSGGALVSSDGTCIGVVAKQPALETEIDAGVPGNQQYRWPMAFATSSAVVLAMIAELHERKRQHGAM
jgi:S1-C subfamily serine protease